MEAAFHFREAATRVRMMAGEPVHHLVRQHLLEVARQLEQSADLHEDLHRKSRGDG